MDIRALAVRAKEWLAGDKADKIVDTATGCGVLKAWEEVAA